MLIRIFIPVIIVFLIFSCSKNEKKGNLTVKGTVKGFQLGTLKIKRLEKDSLITIDSIKIDGQEHFMFQTNIDEPQVMVLELPEVKDGRLSFFAAPGDTIKIFTYVESFGINPIIKGGTNQTAKNEYDKMIRQFNNKEMDLFKARFEASKQHLLKEADSLGKSLENLKRKRALYTLNFIFRHKNQAIAPYLAMMNFYDNPKILDTIYKSLPENLKSIYYSKEIDRLRTATNNKTAK
jgi:hypothetical protein